MSINDMMLAAVTAAAFLYESRFGVFISALFWAHWVFDTVGWTPDEMYYLMAALVDALAVLGGMCLGPAAPRVRRMQAVCLFFIVVQTAGLIIWFQYYPPDVYNLTCTGLYVALLLSIMSRDPKRERDRPDQAAWVHLLVGDFWAARGKVVPQHGDRQT